MSNLPAKLTVEKARALLARCRDVDEVARIKDAARAMAVYLRQQKAAQESVLDAQEIELRAKRRLGELTAALPKAPAGSARIAPKSATRTQAKRELLAQNGLSRQRAAEYEKLASIPAREFERRVSAARQAGAVSSSAVVRPHIARATGNHEWYTPIELVEAARKVMGAIDLDPASCKAANETVCARRFFDKRKDGLAQAWRGRVWLNPPYEQPTIGAFVDKLLKAHAAGDVPQAVVLANNATETRWGQRLLVQAASVCFLSARVRFLDRRGRPQPGALQGQIIVYFGTRLATFARVFGEIGIVFMGPARGQIGLL